MHIGKMLARVTNDFNARDELGCRFRQRRFESFYDLIRQHSAGNGLVRILDVGGTREYWNILDWERLGETRLHIHLLNVPGAMAITARDNAVFSHLEGDGCDLSRFADGEFHIVHSNSVLEHVGDWERMERFAKEIRRVGRSYFVQTPNFWFPLEPHFMVPFIHWLPEPVRLPLVRTFGMGHVSRAESDLEAMHSVQHARLLSRRMVQALFPDAVIITERIVGLPKSFIAVRRAAQA